MTAIPDPFSYRTPSSACFSEWKEQGSRFISHLSPAPDAPFAMTFLESLRKRYHDATHHCWAYRVGWAESIDSRSSDDGEPSHSAGEPILRSMEERGVSDACCVVIRYFGGVKLGTGGLARAYRCAARLAMDAADLRERVLCETWEIVLPYGAQGSLRHCAALLGVQLGESRFGEAVILSARVPRSTAEAFAGRLSGLKEQWRGGIEWKSK